LNAGADFITLNIRWVVSPELVPLLVPNRANLSTSERTEQTVSCGSEPGMNPCTGLQNRGLKVRVLPALWQRSPASAGFLSFGACPAKR
jgi:hypothetical protein